MFIKKSISFMVGMITAFSLLSTADVLSSASERTSVLLGDANNDGYVTMADYTMVLQFLSGACMVSDYEFTAMDINNDKIIDKTDAYIIMYHDAYNIQPQTVNKTLYTLPDNASLRYKKYICSTGVASTYYLSATSLNEASNSISNRDLMSISPDYYDDENTNVVQLIASDGSFGSGFVISDHIIATAAHCVYNSNGFVSGVTVKVYNESANTNPANCIATFSAQSYHIPYLYTSMLAPYNDNYDYALIYVGNDIYGNGLLDYVDPWEFGISTQEFSQAEMGLVTTSGYTAYPNGQGFYRYYSTGSVLDFTPFDPEGNNNPALRITSLGACNGGKSGGIMYYSSSFSNFFKKSAIGITTGGYAPNIGTWGTRVTPALIRFYQQNPYI